MSEDLFGRERPIVDGHFVDLALEGRLGLATRADAQGGARRGGRSRHLLTPVEVYGYTLGGARDDQVIPGLRSDHRLGRHAPQAVDEHQPAGIAPGPTDLHTLGAAAAEEAAKTKATPVVVLLIRFHDLRDTAATLLLFQGVHPKVVSERLGHSRVEITLNTYSHVLPTMQKEPAEKLDRLFG